MNLYTKLYKKVIYTKKCLINYNKQRLLNYYASNIIFDKFNYNNRNKLNLLQNFNNNLFYTLKKNYSIKTMEKDTWKSPLDDLIKENKTIYRTGLFVKNSLLANKKVEFITRDGSKNINWYMCGPTVYDKSHLGHARTYIGFDIIRRILENYFGYNVNLCMNITDIDDKIIKKVIENADKGEDLYTISRKYEDLFFQDMEKLNVKYPDRITRVTEYIPEIIEFIQKLIKNDYAYESNNSVYFNINNFLKAGHQYAKLDPTKVGSAEISQELDGVLGSENVSDKKNKNDFALWKKSKDKEPSWSSPFGRGRPGWHIECSVMCTSVLGKNLDIHSGGYDLKFPHHDNEIAQTEGYYNSHQWINYFLHTGHLNINGLKMSKSLKNFLTIDDIMKQGFSANSFRLSFLNHKYDLEMNYTEKGLEDAYNKDLYIKEYFRTLKRLLSVYNTKQELKYNSKDIEMENLLIKSKNDVHEALCNNFSTETVLEVVNKLISNFNIYATNAESSKNKNEFKVSLAYNYGNFISYILKCFGLVYKTEFLDNLAETDDSEKIIEPFVSAIADYRDDIRNKAIAKDFKGILQVSDNLRDNILPYLGIRLKDRPNDKAIYSIENKDDLIKEIEFQKKLEKQKEDEKRKEKEMKELKLNTPAKEWYPMQTHLYSKFNEEGVPTHKLVISKNKEGVENKSEVELKKEEINKIKKEFKSHQEKYLKNLEKKNANKNEKKANN